jgi:hypothetical protein
MRRYMKHPSFVLGRMENRSGLFVEGDLTQADGHAERRAALDMIHRHSPGSTGQQTLGADKGFDAADFVAEARTSRYDLPP